MLMKQKYILMIYRKQKNNEFDEKTKNKIDDLGEIY